MQRTLYASFKINHPLLLRLFSTNQNFSFLSSTTFTCLREYLTRVLRTCALSSRTRSFPSLRCPSLLGAVTPPLSLRRITLVFVLATWLLALCLSIPLCSPRLSLALPNIRIPTVRTSQIHPSLLHNYSLMRFRACSPAAHDYLI